MPTTTKSPQYQAFRLDVDAVDVSPVTNKRFGLACSGYDIAMFQIIPSGGADPTIEILSWCEAAGRFISVNPVATSVGLGADEPFEVTVSPYGRVLYVSVTALAAGSVDIYSSAYNVGDL